MSEIEAGYLLVDLQEALDRESRGSSVILEGHALGGRAAFTRPSIAALEASTLRPADYGQVQVQGAASPFKGDAHILLASLLAKIDTLVPPYCFTPLISYEVGGGHMLITWGAWGSVRRDGQRRSLRVSGL